jgi:hypothetical protein
MASIPVRGASDKLALRDALLATALAYGRAGRSVVPIGPGRKAPSIVDRVTGQAVEIRWQPYQHVPATAAQLGLNLAKPEISAK